MLRFITALSIAVSLTVIGFVAGLTANAPPIVPVAVNAPVPWCGDCHRGLSLEYRRKYAYMCHGYDFLGPQFVAQHVRPFIEKWQIPCEPRKE